MKAVRVHQFGGLDAIVIEEAPRPAPDARQVLVRIQAAGVGPWDALIRSGQSALHQPLPLILGSDFCGVIESVGSDISDYRPGEEVFGVTNPQFTGAYAEYAVAEAAMIARKPKRLNSIEAASAPVVACTAWQMVFEKGQVDSTKRILVLGAAGNVGAYAVQFAKRAGAEVIAATFPKDKDYVRALGADRVLDAQEARWEDLGREIDVVIDTVGGETLDRAFEVLKPGGVLVSVVAMPDQEKAAQLQIRCEYFIVSVTSQSLLQIAELFDTGQLNTHIGEVLPLAEARLAHAMLAGKPHKPGKIVLVVHE